MPALPPPPNSDLSDYLVQLERRLLAIEEETKGLLVQLHHVEERIAASRSSFKGSTAATAAELRRVEAELFSAVHDVRSLVASFQRSVRRPELNRLQQRIDALALERRIPKEEFVQLLTREIVQSGRP